MTSKRKFETEEQQDLVKILRKSALWFCAIPNGGRRSPSEARRLKREGVMRGAPDLLIFDPGWDPSEQRAYVGVALEMKREGGKPSDVRLDQRQWLAQLRRRGWLCLVGYGCADALAKLRKHGVKV